MTTAGTDPDIATSTQRQYGRSSTAGARRATARALGWADSAVMSATVAQTPAAIAIPQQRDTPPSAAAAPDLGDSTRVRWLSRHSAVLVVVDAVSAVVATVLALALTRPQPATRSDVLTLVALPLLWVVSLLVGHTYELRHLEDSSEDYRRILSLGIRWIGVAGFLALATGSPLVRVLTLVALPVCVTSALVAHAAGHSVEARARRRGITVHRALVIGSERAAAEMIRRLANRDDHGFRIVGALVDTSRHSEIEGVPVVGAAHDVREALAEHGADTLVVAAWSTLSQKELRQLSWELEDSRVDVLVTPNLTDVAGTRISVRPVVGLPLLQVERPEFTGLRRVVKGLFDRTAAGLALAVLAPWLLLLVVAVRIDSPGPAFYRQVRVGRRGSSFPMLKLRSMVVGADKMVADLRDLNEHEEGPLFKMRADPRITRVGSLLRRMSLDELPQLWNVVKGQMSLVGPRPPLPDEVAQYPDEVHRRLLVKPGMTGLWQVSGRSDLNWEESVRLDLYYVDNWSLLLDLSVISRTFRAVVSGRGAY